MSAIKNLFAVLTSPAATYEKLRNNPVWAGAALVLVAVAVLGAAVSYPKMDFEELARVQIENSDRPITEEQVDQAVAIGGKVGPWFALGQTVIGMPVGWLLIALLMWVLVRMLGGLDLSYKQSVATTVTSMAPWIVHTLLSIPLILGRDEIGAEEILRGGPLKHGWGHFVEAEGAMQQLFNSINVFSLWTVALLGIGFAIVGGVSKAKGVGAAVGLWLLGVALKVGWFSLQG